MQSSRCVHSGRVPVINYPKFGFLGQVLEVRIPHASGRVRLGSVPIFFF